MKVKVYGHGMAGATSKKGEAYSVGRRTVERANYIKLSNIFANRHFKGRAPIRGARMPMYSVFVCNVGY